MVKSAKSRENPKKESGIFFKIPKRVRFLPGVSRWSLITKVRLYPSSLDRVHHRKGAATGLLQNTPRKWRVLTQSLSSNFTSIWRVNCREKACRYRGKISRESWQKCSSWWHDVLLVKLLESSCQTRGIFRPFFTNCIASSVASFMLKCWKINFSAVSNCQFNDTR